EDGQDRYTYNLGTDTLGRVTWGAGKTFQCLTGGDDGFGSDSLAIDRDGDSWQDVIVADVDLDIEGYSRRMHIYHSPGGAVGAEIVLRQEPGGAGAADWRGVKGLPADDLRGAHAVAVFAPDNDRDVDIVLGRCAGNFVWTNAQTDPVCQKDL